MAEEVNLDSSIGIKNAYTFWCDVHQQRRHYGACLWLVDTHDKGGFDDGDIYNDCNNAMCKGSCTAVDMRREEIERGAPIYFRDKNVINVHDSLKRVDRDSVGYKRGWNNAGSAIGREKGNVKIESALSYSREKDAKIENLDMSKIITKMAGEKNSKSSKTEGAGDLEKLRLIKSRIIKIAKTDPKKAKQLLEKVKLMEKKYELRRVEVH